MIDNDKNMIDYSKSLVRLKESLRLNSEYTPFLNKISLPFIPAYDPRFSSSYYKTVLIGQETAGWKQPLGQLAELIHGGLSISDYIEQSQARYTELYNASSKGLPFLSFLDTLKRYDDTVQWLNFYLCDYQKKSFNYLNHKNAHIELYEVMRDFSIQHLVQQFNALDAKNMIFVGKYHNNWEKLKQGYVMNEEILQFKTEISFLNIRFWNHKTLVIRLPHPASRVKNKLKLQQHALHYYRLFNHEAKQDIHQFKALIASDLMAFC